jgi:hypothetical protein
MAFPPTGPTALQTTIPSYLYQEYSDDQDLQTFVAGQNNFAQGYLDSVNQINLPDYTGLSGALLDWEAAGLYGILRPVLPSGFQEIVGPYNTTAFNSYAFNASAKVNTGTYYVTSDDAFQRIITWNFFKGDGFVFSIPWLKRRCMRFLLGTNGTSPNIDTTYPVSVAVTSSGVGTITLTGTDPIISPILQAAIEVGACALPFQISWTVNL